MAIRIRRLEVCVCECESYQSLRPPICAPAKMATSRTE